MYLYIRSISLMRQEIDVDHLGALFIVLGIVMHLSMSTPSPARTGTGSEISGDLKLFDAECTLGPGQFEYIRAFDMKLLHFMQQYCQIPVPLRY